VARFGLFVKLDETGADGLVPIRSLGDEYFRHDPDAQTLTGEKPGRHGLGPAGRVKLAEAEPVTGGLMLELLEVEDEPVRRTGKGRRAVRKPVATRAGKAASRRRERRRR
jgi:ribonuclease R